MRHKPKLERDWVDCLKDFSFESVIEFAVNPVTKKQVTLTPPVKIERFEDIANFYDAWEKFCVDATGPKFNPSEIWFPRILYDF
jgi:hypothetical protein